MSGHAYPALAQLIGGRWRTGSGIRRWQIVNPADEQPLGEMQAASDDDIAAALQAAQEAFEVWRKVPADERCVRLERGIARMRGRLDEMATLLTLEQGKTLAEARAECAMAAELIRWYAQEARRIYGRIVPARSPNASMQVHKHPVGPVAAFSPWNFPLVLSARKLGGALAAGCSVILKPAEETPASVAAMVDCLAQELPKGTLQMLCGDPAQISSRLIASPVIRKVSFTGSVPVGRHVAALAAQHLKRVTLELGGHAPVLVFADADLDRVVPLLVQHKFRNAGQACLAPTRFYVQRPVYGRFLDAFSAAAEKLSLGPGLSPATEMGPVIHQRRRDALRDLVDRTVHAGARQLTGFRTPDQGWFVAPTLLADVPAAAPAMREEPFGPIACAAPFDGVDDALAMANASDYGLAGYLYTDSARTIHRVGEALEVGSLAVNGIGVSVPEAPFGGVKDSGYGSESGIEGMEAFLDSRFVHYQA
jgi:acyl-CoA reductase-like NAD-dependent aldehyde dehydrogenase